MSRRALIGETRSGQNTGSDEAEMWVMGIMKAREVLLYQLLG